MSASFGSSGKYIVLFSESEGEGGRNRPTEGYNKLANGSSTPSYWATRRYDIQRGSLPDQSDVPGSIRCEHSLIGYLVIGSGEALQVLSSGEALEPERKLKKIKERGVLKD